MRLSVDDEPLTEAERLRVVYTLIASPETEGGAGITPGLIPWNYVEFISPLGNSKFHKVTSPIFKFQ
jgi:anoctamin-10